MTALVLLAGALGAVLRVAVDGFLPGSVDRVPRGTLAVNLGGSLALGLLVGSGVDEQVLLVAGAGLLGGFTTFSTFAVQTARLPRRAGVANVLANVLGATGFALLGIALGRALA